MLRTNNPGLTHENGAIESQHGHLKPAIAQVLDQMFAWDRGD